MSALNPTIDQVIPQGVSLPRDESSKAPYEWILHPVVDLLFCCGGIVWIFFALHFFGLVVPGGGKPEQIMLLIAALGGIGLSETHVMATLHRVYKNRGQREKFSAYTKWAAIGCAGLAVAGCFFNSLIPILLKVYVLFVAQHFTAQTYGLVMLYCAKNQFSLKNWERKSLAVLMQSAMWVAVLRQLTFADWSGDALLGYKLPFWGQLPPAICNMAEVFAGAAALLVLGMIVRKWFVENRMMPLPAVMLLVTGVSVFTLGKHLSDTLWIYVPAFFHASQYIAVSLAVYLKEKGLPEGISTREIATQITEPAAVRYLAVLLAGALIVFQLLPFLAGLAGLNGMAVAASSFAALHFHHFLTDSAIWKLRDSDTRKLLVA